MSSVAKSMLASNWLELLTLAIETHRSHIPTVFAESDRLALLVAYVITKPRRDDAAPSPLTVAQEIAANVLSHEPDHVTKADEKIGAALLHMAELAGFALIAPAKFHRGARQAPNEVRLTPAAEAHLAGIEARLAVAEIARERPLAEKPPLDVRPSRNRNDLDSAPYPADPLAAAEALTPIQDTAFRVNRYMLEVLGQMPKADADTQCAFALADHYQTHPEFYYRCSFDWRGRIYQNGGRLQYTSGSDAARALLEFAHGEPLTSDGRTFLAVHVATCHGVRGSFTDRAVWTHEHHEQIAWAVADPVGCQDFWYTGRKMPYRFLAACHAWIQQREPIHLPVTADGTASGFQHYAWLLRDELLGRLVNLDSGPLNAQPRDFYAELAAGTPYSRDEIKSLAWMIYGKVPQDERERALHAELKARPELARLWALYNAIRAAARAESKTGRPIEWTLPDGFRVRQANRKAHTAKTALWAFGHRIQARRRELLEQLDVTAQVNGLAPNLIHSLDACLLRAVVRQAPTIDRWAVAHDSLGVHPNYGGALRTAIQAAVAWLYGPDRLSELAWLGTCERVHDLPVSMRGGWYTFS